MNCFDLNDDVNSIITQHLSSDYKFNKKIYDFSHKFSSKFMTDDLRKKIFNEIKVVEIHVEDVCNDVNTKSSFCS